jgi:hypothetical protein
MKGQMFTLAAVIIVSALLILRTTIRAPEISEKRKALEATLETKIFDNLVNELQNAVKISAHDKENISKNVHDFGNFTRDKISGRALDFKFFFVGSLARVNGVLNTSVINLLGSSRNVTLNLNGTIANSIVSDGGRWDTNFTISPGDTYVLTVNFENYTENVSIKTKNNKDVYVGFFDVYLESEWSSHRNKFQRRYVLN